MWLLDIGKVRSYVPCILLVPLKKAVQWYHEALLPHWMVWKQQAPAHHGGDKTTLCKTFLHHIIPYFVEVLVQDGTWFVRDFPSQPPLYGFLS
jgi:hypothetical protein